MQLLNVSVSPLKFKYEDLSTLAPLLQSSNFITMIDLKDSFHHVSVLPAHQHLLAFAWQNQMYTFQVLPFSLAASPWIFTHYVQATVCFLCHQGIQVMAYMDNVIILSQSYTKAHHHTTFTLCLFKKLGWMVNAKKSNTTQDGCSATLPASSSSEEEPRIRGLF